MDHLQQYELITKRVTVRNSHLIREKLRNGGNIKGVWGTAPTGRPHIGYFVPFVKLAEFVAAGVDTHIMFADTYAFLVNYEFSIQQVAHRTQYYQQLARAILQAMRVPLDKVTLAVESESHSYTSDFVRDEHKLYALLTQETLRQTSDELRQTPRLSPLLCPSRQALLGAHYGVDFELGGIDQVGCYNIADEYLPQLGHKTRGFLLNPLLPGLQVKKMSSSHTASAKIEFLDPADVVRSKIESASCPPAQKEDNPILAFLELVIMPLREVQNHTSGFAVQASHSSSSSSRTTLYRSYADIEHDYISQRISPTSLKSAVADAINELLEPIRQAYASNSEWQAEDKLAYPEDYEQDQKRPSSGTEPIPPAAAVASEPSPSTGSSTTATKHSGERTQSPFSCQQPQIQDPKASSSLSRGIKARLMSTLKKVFCLRKS